MVAPALVYSSGKKHTFSCCLENGFPENLLQIPKTSQDQVPPNDHANVVYENAKKPRSRPNPAVDCSCAAGITKDGIQDREQIYG